MRGIGPFGHIGHLLCDLLVYPHVSASDKDFILLSIINKGFRMATVVGQ